jgi:putative ABC transporter transmembrane
VADTRTAVRKLLGLIADRKAEFAVVFTLQTALAVVGVVTPTVVGRAVDAVAAGTTSSYIRNAIAFIAVVVVIQAILGYAASLRAYVFSQKILAVLRERVVRAVTSLPLGTVEAAGSGDMIGRTTHDVDRVSFFIEGAVSRLFMTVLTIAATLVAIFVANPLLGGVVVLTAAPIFFTVRFYVRRGVPAYLAASAISAGMSGVASETVEQSTTADAMRLGRVRAERMDTLIYEYWRNEVYTGWVRMLFIVMNQLVTYLPVVTGLALGGYMIGIGQTTYGTVTAIVLYASQLRYPLWTFSWWADEFQFAMAALARIFGVEEASETGTGEESGESGGVRKVSAGSVRDTGESGAGASGTHDTGESGREAREEPSAARVSGAAAEAEAAGPDSSGGFDAALHIEDVHFAYREGQDVLHGVTLDVDGGETVAIVGPSGAGKSTLGRLIAGINAPAAGSVRIGRAEVSSMPESALHTAVAMVTQEHHVFLGSLAHNMRLAKRDATDEEIRSALEAVEATWVDDLEDGLETKIGSGGLALTPPQAQQLALARIVLLDPAVLVLDEATSQLNPTEARSLERALGRVLKGRTVVSIAHRLYTAHDADRVAVMIDGRVAEYGSHDELTARGGEYAALWNAWQSD